MLCLYFGQARRSGYEVTKCQLPLFLFMGDTREAAVADALELYPDIPVYVWQAISKGIVGALWGHCGGAATLQCGEYSMALHEGNMRCSRSNGYEGAAMIARQGREEWRSVGKGRKRRERRVGGG